LVIAAYWVAGPRAASPRRSDGCCAGALSGNGADADGALEASPVTWFVEVVAMLVPVIAEVLAGLVILWLAVRLRQTGHGICLFFGHHRLINR
jgi:hypothetical protein